MDTSSEHRLRNYFCLRLSFRQCTDLDDFFDLKDPLVPQSDASIIVRQAPSDGHNKTVSEMNRGPQIID